LSPDSVCRSSELRPAIVRVRGGELNAYKAIYEVCDRPLRSFIGRRYGLFGSDFVDEVAIRTHEYAFTHIDKYDSDKGASFQTWLNWQSRNIAAQVMAEWAVRGRPHRAKKHEAGSTTAAGPETELAARLRDRALKEELTALPDDERLVILYHDLEMLTLAETAEATSLTIRQVRYKRAKGLATMKRRLQARGVEPVEIDMTPVPIYHGWDCTEPDDDFTVSVTAVLPEGPRTLEGAAAQDVPQEEKEE
jgi:RNA polymerase sigma factor (sigma-70 family)